ncbi:MAG: patatin-like phospholipase family protein [Planctomycetes bacterium]|nr:patatin-like phospholipase family protein [Planctomycetota bacterium]
MLDLLVECVRLFVHGFCVSLVRPGIVIFLVLVLLGLGRGIGLPILFWRPREKSEHPEAGKTNAARWPQFLVGIGIGALVWQVLLGGYLFEEFATNYTLDRSPFCEVRPMGDGIKLPITHVPAMPPFSVLGYELQFREVHTDFSMRFRYDPLAFGTLWGYAIGVVVGGMIIVVVMSLASALLPVLVWLLVRGRRSWTPFQRFSKPAALPISPWLPSGILVGMIALSGVTWGWFKLPSTQQTGQVMTTVADWGSATGRQEVVKVKLKAFQEKRPNPDEKETRSIQAEAAATAKEWYAPYYPVYGAFVFNFVLCFVVSVVMMCLPRRLSFFTPALGIVLLLHLLIASSTLLNYFSPIPGEFIAIVLVGIVVLSGRAYKLKFPNMGNLYDHPLDLNRFYQEGAQAELAAPPNEPEKAVVGAQGDVPPSGSETPIAKTSPLLLNSETIPFGRTQSGSTSGTGPSHGFEAVTAKPAMKPRLAIVCVSGGGSRAAAWTMKTLLEIEKAFAQTNVAFPYHVRLVTGASGGMIAASYYVASLAEPDSTPTVRRNQSLTEQHLFDGVCKDFLTPITHTLVSRDLPSLFFPMHLGRYDRGTILEEEWKTALSGQLDQTFQDLRPGEEAGWRPSLIFSPMMVEDGRQLFISNLDLSRVVRNSAMILGEVTPPNPLNPPDAKQRRLLSREGMEFFKAFPSATDFRLSTAARMSASFPYVLPAAYLPTNPPRRVVDAGYYDNYGVGIATSWLFNHMQWIEENTSGVVVIQIRDGTSGPSRRRESVSDSFPSTPAAGVHWLTSPARGLWSFRQAAHAFHNDNLLHLLNQFFEARKLPPRFLSTIGFEFPQGDDVALSFTLTEGEREMIHAAATKPEFQSQIGSLLDWWHAQ